MDASHFRHVQTANDMQAITAATRLFDRGLRDVQFLCDRKTQQEVAELAEETSNSLTALSHKYEVLEAAVFGPGGLAERLLSAELALKRLTQKDTQ